MLREQFGHHSGRDVYVLNGIEVGEMRDDTFSKGKGDDSTCFSCQQTVQKLQSVCSDTQHVLCVPRLCHWVVATVLFSPLAIRRLQP